MTVNKVGKALVKAYISVLKRSLADLLIKDRLNPFYTLA